MNGIVTGIIVFLLAAGGFWFYSNSGTTPAPQRSAFTLEHTSEATTTIAETLGVSGSIPEGYVEYRNEKYGFSYYHAPEAVITEYDEGSGAMTITQENVAKVRGLQIFIVPYSEATISEERFKRDVPSGVRTNVQATIVDGVPAVTFNSYVEPLGDTREVWFIHNGYLYEVTTFKGVREWFAPIVESWKFF